MSYESFIIYIYIYIYTHLLEPSKKMFAWEDHYIILSSTKHRVPDSVHGLVMLVIYACYIVHVVIGRIVIWYSSIGSEDGMDNIYNSRNKMQKKTNNKYCDLENDIARTTRQRQKRGRHEKKMIAREQQRIDCRQAADRRCTQDWKTEAWCTQDGKTTNAEESVPIDTQDQGRTIFPPQTTHYTTKKSIKT